MYNSNTLHDCTVLYCSVLVEEFLPYCTVHVHYSSWVGLLVAEIRDAYEIHVPYVLYYAIQDYCTA